MSNMVHVTYRRSQSARSEALFLSTARDLTVKSDLGLSSDVKSADALRSVQLVSTDRHQINWGFADIDRQLANALSGISMEKDFFGSAKLANLFNRLLHTDLIVHMNDTDRQGVRSDCLLEDLEVNKTVSLHWQVSHIEALVFKVSAGVKDALVFNLGRDEVLLVFTVEASQTFEAKII